MADTVTAPQEPDLYARFPSCTSKEARENLPALIDQVVDIGKPLLIKKLNVGRAALIPARELWIHEIVERLGMDRASVNTPIPELMKEVSRRIKNYLEAQAESDMHAEEEKPGSGAEKIQPRETDVHGLGKRRAAR